MLLFGPFHPFEGIEYKMYIIIIKNSMKFNTDNVNKKPSMLLIAILYSLPQVIYVL